MPTRYRPDPSASPARPNRVGGASPRHPGPRAASWWPLIPSLVLTLALGTARVEAQSVAASDVNMGTIDRRIERITPKSGAPGTVVRVDTHDMPVITPVRVGIGAARIGFEAFQELLTGDEGEFDVTVEVPTWAVWDRVHVFIVFDIYFRPIALSDAFHVTDERGMVRRTGRVERRSPECTLMRDTDGVQYALTGDRALLGELPTATTVVLDGRIVDAEVCGFRNVLEVLERSTN